MPKLSVVIPYYELDKGKREVLERTVKSLGGYDELILVWNQRMGFLPALNVGYSLAKGDFIAMVCDDVILKTGTLYDLCDASAVTSAQIEGMPEGQDFWGTLWVTPRWVWEKTGPFDEEYAKGSYFDDDDYYMTLRHNNIRTYVNPTVRIEHPEGGRTLDREDDKRDKTERNREYFVKKWGHMPIREQNRP